MASSSSSCSSSSFAIAIPELNFLYPHLTPRRFVSLSRTSVSGLSRSLSRDLRPRPPRRIRAAAVEERERELIEGGNGRAGNGSYSNGGVRVSESANGSLVTNGSLRKYDNGNGNGAAAAATATVTETPEVVVVEDVAGKEEGRKKRIEEIGKEDAWFKKSSGQKVEVSVAPGGRWNRFKTYSTIQRTLEIWGFVLTFVFRAWFNNRKFAYRGGMTEAKKVLKRKALAKWLKESILRLGPTFIKIGQQFSTRVDILAQEYIDQLSELQDQVPPFPSETAVSIIEEELGPVNDIFERFDYEPIAAASLGQVHRARLKGQEVVLKVQRPGLKSLFDIDLKNLRGTSRSSSSSAMPPLFLKPSHLRIACKAADTAVAEASEGAGKNWVPVVPLSALPRGERRVILQDNQTILLLWYKDQVFAIENRSPAEGAYTEGLLNAKLTQDGCIVCPTTDSLFDLRSGEIKNWYPNNPVLRVLTPPLKQLIVYPVKADEENIYISLSSGIIKPDASAEIVFSGKAQPGVTASDVNVDEIRMVVDDNLEGFGFSEKNEIINGKTAIIGFLFLLDFELLTGKGLLKGTGFLDFIYAASNGFK